MAGGVRGGRKLKAVIPGGSSAPILTAAEIAGIPMDFDGIAAAKSMFGSAAIIVMDETTDIPKAVTNIAKFYAHESCGQCTPCREGTPWLLKMLRRIVNGEGKKTDLDLLLQISNQMGNGMTICVFADAAIAPVISGITKFRGEFEAYVEKSTKPGFEQGASDDLTNGNRRPHGRRNSLLMAKVTVDGKTVEVPNDANALEACRAAGVDVPHFCYHPALSIVGQCRMCMVEVEGVPKIQASCTVPVRDGMVIKASTEKALAARNATMEFLLINHPLDCPICDQAGECKLQDNAVAGGLPVSRTSEPRRQFPGYDRTEIGPHVIADMTRCIQCTRCIRFCQEITETGELTFIERGGHTIVWTHEGKALDNDLSGCAADVCPVGALTTKEFRFRKRVWWLDKTRSICDGCEIGCSLSIEHRDGVVYRYTPARPARRERLLALRLRPLPGRGPQRAGLHEARDPRRGRRRERKQTNWGEALDAVKARAREGKTEEKISSRVIVLGSAFLTTEEAWLLATLCKDSLKVNAPEFTVDVGPKRRIRNKRDGWLYGTEAAPNSRGCEAAGLSAQPTKAGRSPLSLLLSKKSSSSPPSVLYVTDANFSEKCERPRLRRRAAQGVGPDRPRPQAQRADGRGRHRAARRRRSPAPRARS